MFTVYGNNDSGNSYKVKLVLEQLQLPYKWAQMDSTRGETRTAEFLAKNPNGKVPTLQLEDGGFLPESDAFLCYLAEGSALMPGGRLDRAHVLQWMFFEQYSHEPYVAVARSVIRYLPPDSPRRAELLTAAGYAFTVQSADVDESGVPGETPEAYVVRVARAKARAIAAGRRESGSVVLATPVCKGLPRNSGQSAARCGLPFNSQSTARPRTIPRGARASKVSRRRGEECIAATMKDCGVGTAHLRTPDSL